MKAALAQGHTHFSSACGFMVNLGKPPVHVKFEVANLSHCVNIEVEPQNVGELP